MTAPPAHVQHGPAADSGTGQLPGCHGGPARCEAGIHRLTAAEADTGSAGPDAAVFSGSRGHPAPATAW